MAQEIGTLVLGLRAEVDRRNAPLIRGLACLDRISTAFIRTPGDL